MFNKMPIERDGCENLARKPSPAVYQHPKLEEYLQSLPSDAELQKMIKDMEQVLMENMYAGDLVQKRMTPKHYVEDYHLNPRSPNLYVYDHPKYYRSCYTIARKECGVCPIILDINDHNEYNKKFGYKKK